MRSCIRFRVSIAASSAATVNAGVRVPFFKRNLNSTASPTDRRLRALLRAMPMRLPAANPYVVNPTTGLPVSGYAAPQQRVFTYAPAAERGRDLRSRMRPSFANYSKGLQVPGTDNLYNSFYFPVGNASAKPDPETTDNFDLGVRYRSGKLMAQVSTWYTIYQNRLASAFDRDLNTTIYRNLGRVDKYGIDGSLAYAPVKDLAIYVLARTCTPRSATTSSGGSCTATNVTLQMYGCTAAGTAFYQTAGKRESGARSTPSVAVSTARSGRSRWACRPSAPVRAMSTTRTCRST
jgi:iron complex outermembrane receptor protein